ncbi:MAG: ABC transporter permease, partial [Gemmatimonadota bacterium]
METLWQDIRYALRTLGSARLVTVVATLTIAIGVGATTTMLSVANALLVRPPAGVVDPGRLITVHSLSQSGSSFHSFSYQDFEDLAAAKDGLQSLAAYGMLAAGLRAGDEPQLVAGMLVSGEYFKTLGTRTELGRFFSAEENREGGPPVVVLSDALWRRRFAADPAILGRTVVINGQPLTVIGVAQPDFHGHFAGISISLWAPLALNDILTHRAELHNRGTSWLELVGRLSPGATPSGVAAALSPVSARDGRLAGLDWDRGVDVRHYLPVPASAALPVGGFLGLLVILAGFVLLIASANVGTVLLARAATQNRAMAVRLALGATRGRLLRQRLTESVALFLAGGTVGTGLAYAATWALSRIEPPTEVPLALDFHPDPLVLAITLIVTLVAGLTFGLAPALQSAEADPALLLREGATTLRMTRTRLRGALVGGQVAATACLLVTAGLFARGLSRAGDLHPGFEPSGVRVMSVDLSVRNYDDARKVAFVETMERRAAALPGVVSVATTDLVPLNLSNQETEIALPERPAQPDIGLFQVDFTGVTSGYFTTMRIPLLQGRTFGPADRDGAPAVAIVNQTMATRLWPGENAIGKRINYGSFTRGTPTEIIGVAADAKYRNLGEDPLSMVYVPMAQQPRPRVTLLVRSTAGATESSRALRDAVREFDPDLPIGQDEMLESVIG